MLFIPFREVTPTHAAEMHRLDVEQDPNATIDPILQALPGARRRREHGWTVYEAPHLLGAIGKRELLRCDAASIIVQGADDDRIRAGLQLAAQRYKPPLRITGTPAFVRRSQELADALGIAYEVPQQAEVVQAPAAERPAAPTEPERKGAAGKYVVMPTDERLEALKGELGVRFLSTLSKLTKSMKVEGTAVKRLPQFWPDADGIVVRIDDNALIVPVDRNAHCEIDGSVRIVDGDEGRFGLEPVVPEQATDIGQSQADDDEQQATPGLSFRR